MMLMLMLMMLMLMMLMMMMTTMMTMRTTMTTTRMRMSNVVMWRPGGGGGPARGQQSRGEPLPGHRRAAVSARSTLHSHAMRSLPLTHLLLSFNED